MVRMILNSHFTLINTGGACIEGKQVWAHVMIMLSEWYFFVLYKSWLYEFHFNLWCMSIVIFDELIRHAIVRYNYCNRTFPPPPLSLTAARIHLSSTGARLSDGGVLYYLFPSTTVIKIRNCKCFFVYCNKTNVSII